jgi:hypothetical protein
MTRRNFLKGAVSLIVLMGFGRLFAGSKGEPIFNETGMRVYRGYISGRNPEQIASDLVAEYEVDYETALRDTKEFIRTIRTMGL